MKHPDTEKIYFPAVRFSEYILPLRVFHDWLSKLYFLLLFKIYLPTNSYKIFTSLKIFSIWILISCFWFISISFSSISSQKWVEKNSILTLNCKFIDFYSFSVSSSEISISFTGNGFNFRIESCFYCLLVDPLKFNVLTLMPAIGKGVAEFELEEIFIFVDVESVACVIEGP